MSEGNVRDLPQRGPAQLTRAEAIPRREERGREGKGGGGEGGGNAGREPEEEKRGDGNAGGKRTLGSARQ